MNRHFYTLLAFLLLVVFNTNMVTAQNNAGPLTITSINGEELEAGSMLTDLSPGDTINIKGTYQNPGAAVSVVVSYQIFAPDWSGAKYTNMQTAADANVGTLNGMIDFDYVLPADAPLFGAFHDTVDMNTINAAHYIIQTRVEYNPAEDTFWNYFIQVSDQISSTKQPVLEGLQIFPNPAENELTIQTPVGLDKFVQVYDMTGRLLLEQTLNGNVLDISRLQTGFHIVRVEQDGKVAGQKIMIK